MIYLTVVPDNQSLTLVVLTLNSLDSIPKSWTREHLALTITALHIQKHFYTVCTFQTQTRLDPLLFSILSLI